MPNPVFPSYVKLGWKDSADDPGSPIERTPMERGIPKQRRVQADVLVSVPVTLFFDSAAHATDFETWFYGQGLGWFDFTHPRTNAVVPGRIVGGRIGQLAPLKADWSRTSRQTVIEYVRATL